MFPLFRIHCI